MHALLAQATVNAAVPTWQIVGIILSAVLGFASTVISSLVLFTMKNLTDRLGAVESCQKSLVERKIECQRDFVSAENWVRSETYTRNKIDAVFQEMQKLASSVAILDKLPEITGAITREAIRQSREGSPS